MSLTSRSSSPTSSIGVSPLLAGLNGAGQAPCLMIRVCSVNGASINCTLSSWKNAGPVNVSGTVHSKLIRMVAPENALRSTTPVRSPVSRF